MRGGGDVRDDLGRDVPEFEITRWSDGHGWHDEEPDLATLKAHVGDPDFIYTIRFPDSNVELERDAYYNMVGGFESWDDLLVAIVDMYIDYIVGGGK